MYEVRGLRLQVRTARWILVMYNANISNSKSCLDYAQCGH